jgi:hypothetical protein
VVFLDLVGQFDLSNQPVHTVDREPGLVQVLVLEPAVVAGIEGVLAAVG